MKEKEYKTPNYPKKITARRKEKPFNLSEKIANDAVDWKNPNRSQWDFIFVTDVREFVRRLKLGLFEKVTFIYTEKRRIQVEGLILNLIDKLAGEKLVK